MTPLKPDKPTGKANGKVILLGEHAVVHGTPALAVALPDRMTVEAEFADGPITLEVPDWGFATDASAREESGKALRDMIGVLGIRPFGMRLTGRTDLPPRSGLGASAALAAASARAIGEMTRNKYDFDTLFRAVQASECVFHGNPSGLDAAVALGGGVISFSVGDGASPTGAPPPPIVLIHSGQEGVTSDMVARVAARMYSYPEESALKLEAIGRLAERGTDAIRVWDLPTLGSLMIENQRYLDWFGVSTPALNKICAVAIGAGALGAKLTGGGGGGCAVALVTLEYREAVCAAVKAAGFTVVTS